ncbi:MAG: bifunctional oligoribonuclease/PAP phosphatase NrnA [Bacteroidales bacterium]
MTESEITEISEYLVKEKTICLISHANPDGDAVGSMLAFYAYLKANQLSVSAILPDAIPDFYQWLPAADELLFADQDFQLCHDKLQQCDIVFCLDFNGFKRVGDLEKSLTETGAIRVLVDHHPNPQGSFDYVLSNTEVSSTAELVYELIRSLGGEGSINLSVAQSVYVGMMTDTGSFNFNSDHPQMYAILQHLVDLGVKPDLMHQKVFDNFTESRLRLLGYSLSQKMTVIPQAHVAYIALSKDDLENFNFQKGDTEGLVNYPLSIKNVVFAAIFIEKDNMVKISFRSKGSFNANEFASKHFRGGGHLNASGGKSYHTLKQAVETFESLVNNEFKTELNNAISKL